MWRVDYDVNIFKIQMESANFIPFNKNNSCFMASQMASHQDFVPMQPLRRSDDTCCGVCWANSLISDVAYISIEHFKILLYLYNRGSISHDHNSEKNLCSYWGV